MSEPLRILQLYPKHDYFTGAAIQLRELALGLRDGGHQVVVATRPNQMWSTRMREASIPHYALPMSSEVDLYSVRRLIPILREHKIQIVHAQKGKARTIAMLAGLFTRIPVLILNRGVSFPLDPFNRLGYTTRRVTAIVAVCDSIKRGLVRQGVDPKKVVVIYSGTDTKRFHPHVDGSGVRRELGLAPHHLLITQIGTRSWKGNDDVLDALAKAAPALPQARLLFVGGTDPRARVLRQQAAMRGIEHLVSVFPNREDIPQILGASDVTVDASYAGLGLTGTLRESLAVGTPVIGTDLEGNPELIAHGETGLLVPPRDPGALAEALLTMARDPARAKAMAEKGQARVEKFFSTAAKVARTEELYRRVLGGQPAA